MSRHKAHFRGHTEVASHQLGTGPCVSSIVFSKHCRPLSRVFIPSCFFALQLEGNRCNVDSMACQSVVPKKGKRALYSTDVCLSLLPCQYDAATGIALAQPRTTNAHFTLYHGIIIHPSAPEPSLASTLHNSERERFSLGDQGRCWKLFRGAPRHT